METKKSPKANLENKRALFYMIGMVISLALALVAFEWETKQTANLLVFNNDNLVEMDELPPITRPEEPEPPKPELPKPLDVFELVSNEEELTDEPLFASSEATIDTEVHLNNVKVDEEESDEPVPYFKVENKPEFPGGDKALLIYLAKNIRYPAICQENGIQGNVYLSFVINERGQVTNVQVIQSPDRSLADEAVRVVRTMPDWKPGKQGNKGVKVTYQLPVKFRLQ